jgi:hypothetical protein
MSLGKSGRMKVNEIWVGKFSFGELLIGLCGELFPYQVEKKRDDEHSKNPLTSSV